MGQQQWCAAGERGAPLSPGQAASTPSHGHAGPGLPPPSFARRGVFPGAPRPTHTTASSAFSSGGSAACGDDSCAVSSNVGASRARPLQPHSTVPPYRQRHPSSSGGSCSNTSSGGAVAVTGTHVRVVCGDLEGVLVVGKDRVLFNVGPDTVREVAPTEFERLAGRSATKKWRQSIRLVEEDGSAGRPIGDWLDEHGLRSKRVIAAANGHEGRAVSPSPSTSQGALRMAGMASRSGLSGGQRGTASAGAGGNGATSSWSARPGAFMAGASRPDAAAKQRHRAASAHYAQMPAQAVQPAPAFCRGAQLAPTSAAAPAAAAAQAAPLPPSTASAAIARMAQFLAGQRPSPPLDLLGISEPIAVLGAPLDLRSLFFIVARRGGYTAIGCGQQWLEVADDMGFPPEMLRPAAFGLMSCYRQYLLRFERLQAADWQMLTGGPSPLEEYEPCNPAPPAVAAFQPAAQRGAMPAGLPMQPSDAVGPFVTAQMHGGMCGVAPGLTPMAESLRSQLPEQMHSGSSSDCTMRAPGGLLQGACSASHKLAGSTGMLQRFNAHRTPLNLAAHGGVHKRAGHPPSHAQPSSAAQPLMQEQLQCLMAGRSMMKLPGSSLAAQQCGPQAPQRAWPLSAQQATQQQQCAPMCAPGGYGGSCGGLALTNEASVGDSCGESSSQYLLAGEGSFTTQGAMPQPLAPAPQSRMHCMPDYGAAAAYYDAPGLHAYGAPGSGMCGDSSAAAEAAQQQQQLLQAKGEAAAVHAMGPGLSGGDNGEWMDSPDIAEMLDWLN